MSAIIGTLRYFGIPVTKDNYIRLATLGATIEFDPESEAEMEAALEDAEYMTASWSRRRNSHVSDRIRAHGLGVQL